MRSGRIAAGHSLMFSWAVVDGRGAWPARASRITEVTCVAKTANTYQAT